MPQKLTFALTSAWAAYLVVLGIWIVLQKRSPAATISWMLSLAAFPYLGLVIFYVFGPQRLKRSRIRRLGSKRIVAAERSLLQNASQAMQIPERTRQLAALVRRSGGFEMSTASSVELLIDGAQTYEALFAAIRAARDHIHLEYYIYEPDAVGTALRDLLIDKAREGVKVRLLLDAIGSQDVSRRFMRGLTDAGGELAFFHSARFRTLRPMINMRTHRKIAICDGCVGFTGGINITDDEDPRVRPDAFHDAHIRIEGLAVHRLQQVFIEDWHYTTSQMLGGTALAPDLPSGRHFVQVIASGPDTEQAPILRAMVTAIDQATERIWLTTPYFVPDDPALFSLVSAALRGVDVCILVPRRSDSWLVTMAARSYFDELIAAGVRLFEYQPRMLHSKTMVVDERYAFIGTANFDNRSFRLNFEVSVLLYEPSLVKGFAEQFGRDLLDAQLVRRQRKLRWYEQFVEASARLCAPLL